MATQADAALQGGLVRYLARGARAGRGDHPRVRGGALAVFSWVGSPGADVKERPDALLGEQRDDPRQKAPVGPGEAQDVRHRRHDLVRRRPVGRVVVFPPR